MSYGLNLNCCLVENDGQYEAGFSIEDSDGIDIEYTIAGTNLNDMLEEAIADVLEEFYLQQYDLEDETDDVDEDEYDDIYVAQLEKIIEDLTLENNSLKTDLEILQKRADDAVNEKLHKKEDIFENKDFLTFDDILHYLRRL